MAFGARVFLVLALALGVGCGRSIRHAGDDADAAGASGNSAGGTGGRGGASGSGGAVTGGTSGTSGSGAVGGEPNEGTRLFYESDGALVSTDFSGAEFVELCPGHEDWTRYTLIGTDGARVIVYLERYTDLSTGLRTESSVLSVAPDGSACDAVYSDAGSYPIAPVAGDRVVLVIPPTPTTLELPVPGAPERIVVPATGLASVRTDGTGFEVLAPSGVSGSYVVGDRVIYSYSDTAGSELYTSYADGTERTALVPFAGSKTVSFVSGSRLVVSLSSGNVVSVDPDGGRLVELAMGPDTEYAEGIAGDRVVINRQVISDGMGQSDLFAVPIDGGELVPLATGPSAENFAGASGDRVVFHVDYQDIESVRLDGSELVVIANSEEREYVSEVEGDRVFFTQLSTTGGTEPLVSAAVDGTDVVVLAPHIGDLAAIVGDRAIVIAGAATDVFSIPVTGGDAVVLADNAEPDSVVGRLGRTLILQTGLYRGKIARIDADGSEPTELLSFGRYVGAITEGCGVVPSDNRTSCKDP